MGLNDDFNVVRSNVYAMKEVPQIDVIFDMVTQEEIQRKANSNTTVEALALYGNTTSQRSFEGNRNYAGK